jgi:hypothetical protein
MGSGKVFAISEFERRKNVAAGFTVKNRVEVESRRPRCSTKEEPGAAVPHFFIPGMAKIGHESLAGACTGETPVLLNLSFWFFGKDFSFMLLI